jgi:FYVE zinc finger
MSRREPLRTVPTSHSTALAVTYAFLTMPFKFKSVSTETKRLIDLGDQVIRDCRAIVAMGAGNQVQNVAKTQGKSAYLTAAVQSDQKYQWDRPLRNGTVTVAYAAGNCQDQAAVTYTILRSKLTAAEQTSFCVNNAIHHSFATIGVPGTDPEDQVICVDPWPIKAQAILLEDHFCKVGVQVLRHKKGGKGDYMQRLNKPKNKSAEATAKKQIANASVFDVSAIINSAGMWNHEYCSNDGITWVYKVRPEWIADEKRAHCQRCHKPFSFYWRRHHCRSCGEIFCDFCTNSRTKVGIPATEPRTPDVDLSKDAVRVCTPCFNKIKNDGFGG